jgi:hypothetical protein
VSITHEFPVKARRLASEDNSSHGTSHHLAVKRRPGCWRLQHVWAIHVNLNGRIDLIMKLKDCFWIVMQPFDDIIDC